MSEIPLLTFCIPTYNRPVWFERALKSIISDHTVSQSRLEIVISDDSNNNNCQEITNNLLKNWQGKWTYINNSPRLGMTENWNQSIKYAVGEYILILHDDDFLLPNVIGEILKIIEELKENYSVFLFGVEVINEQEKILKRQLFKEREYLPSKQALIRLLSNSSFVRFPAIIIKRNLIEEVGYFDSKWREPCDLEMWIRLFSRYGVFCLPLVTVAYTVHSQALTMRMFNLETINLLQEIFSEVETLNLLSKAELESCKALFFHQFILAGGLRQLRGGKFREFQKVIKLFKAPKINDLQIPKKWLLIRLLFEFLSKL